MEGVGDWQESATKQPRSMAPRPETEIHICANADSYLRITLSSANRRNYALYNSRESGIDCDAGSEISGYILAGHHMREALTDWLPNIMAAAEIVVWEKMTTYCGSYYEKSVVPGQSSCTYYNETC